MAKISPIRLSRGRTFDTATGEVSVEGRLTRLEPQPAALLALLAARAGTLVTHADIRDQIWRDGRHVDYAAGVHYSIRQIRRALGQAKSEPPDIDTLPRRGYRLRATSLATPAHAPFPEAPVSSATPAWPRRSLLLTAALAAAVLVGLVERHPNQHHQQAVALVRMVHDVIY